jgi:hypothetical protein
VNILLRANKYEKKVPGVSKGMKMKAVIRYNVKKNTKAHPTPLVLLEINGSLDAQTLAEKKTKREKKRIRKHN